MSPPPAKAADQPLFLSSSFSQPVINSMAPAMRRKVVTDSAPLMASLAGEADRQEHIQLSSAISNGEDLGPFVRKAFASGRPETLQALLRQFARFKESKIEKVCKAHIQEFNGAVDDLRSLLSAAESLKSSLSDSNAAIQSAAVPLLDVVDAFLEARSIAQNLSDAIDAARLCVRLFDILARANAHIEAGNLYLALRAVDAVERDLLPVAPHPTIRQMLLRLIPDIRAHAERCVNKDFSDWMVHIRAASRHLGQVAIGRASAARQREEDLRIKQRQAEEQTRNASDPSNDHGIYSLEEHEDADDLAAAAAAFDGGIVPGFDLTPLYRAFHIHRTLGFEGRFQQYYLENRKLQLTSDFQVSSMTPFLESHQTFFAQIAGFFIIEDRILRTAGGLISRSDVDGLWETAVSQMVSVLEDQFATMQTASHLLLIKDYVSLFSVTLRRYGYPVDALIDVLAKHRGKYHDLLLSDCRRRVSDALMADKFEQMLMKKEYEYSMNVLSFQIQTSDIVPAFPYLAPFSSTVPDLCRITRSFVEDSVSFMSHGGQLDFYPVVKKYLERLLSEVIDDALLQHVNSGGLDAPQAMQMAANMTVMERACGFFYRHAAQLSGIALGTAERARREFPLKKSKDAAEELLLGLLKKKVDDCMLLSDGIDWLSDDPPQDGNDYSNEVLIYLATVISPAHQILPINVLRGILTGILTHISHKIVGLFLNDAVKRFNFNALAGIDADLKTFESFADKQSRMFSDWDDSAANDQLQAALTEARQLINLLMSNRPENFLDPLIRESYSTLDYEKVIAILEKFEESSDRLSSTIGTGTSKQTKTKKALDAIMRRLKDSS